MVKPIVYNSIKEKNRIEIEMFKKIPFEIKSKRSKRLMNLFSKEEGISEVPVRIRKK